MKFLKDIKNSVYIDDVLVASKSKEDHKKHLRAVIDEFNKNGLVVSQSKMK